jgi:GT2 family glycosyltransferase
VTVSIVIPHYGRAELTIACLSAVAHHTRDVEVIVVDNGTGDRFTADVRINNPENLGFAVACNQGAAAATGDIIVFLNNDTEVHAGWLEPLVAALTDDVAAVGALLLYPDGRVQHGGVELSERHGLLWAENIHEVGVRRDMPAVTAACMLVDKPKFFAVGGFDTGYWNGADDVDLCLSFRRAGWRVVYEPASVVTHHESKSGPERWSRLRDNVMRLHDKWGLTEVRSGG